MTCHDGWAQIRAAKCCSRGAFSRHHSGGISPAACSSKCRNLHEFARFRSRNAPASTVFAYFCTRILHVNFVKFRAKIRTQMPQFVQFQVYRRRVFARGWFSAGRVEGVANRFHWSSESEAQANTGACEKATSALDANVRRRPRTRESGSGEVGWKNLWCRRSGSNRHGPEATRF
jgi:hypothetical protein